MCIAYTTIVPTIKHMSGVEPLNDNQYLVIMVNLTVSDIMHIML